MRTASRAAFPAALLLLTGLSPLLPAGGDPSFTSLSPMRTLAVWDLNDSNYSASPEIVIGGGNATLGTTAGSFLQDQDGDFIPNGTLDASLEIADDSIRLAGDPSNRVTDGDFSAGTNWTYANTSRAVAAWDSTNLSGGMGTGTPWRQEDSFDDGASSFRWTGVGGGATCGILSDDPLHVEGAESVRCDYNNPGAQSNWAGASKDQAGTWDWSAYNRLAIWLNATNTSGSGNLTFYIYLDDTVILWSSANQSVGAGWENHVFDLTAFTAAGGDLSIVNQVDIRFTNLTGTATLYIDDLVLFNASAAEEAGTISQVVTKPATPPWTGGTLLQFSYNATAVANATAWLNVTRNGTAVWSQPLAPGLSGSVYLDASAPFAAGGDHALAFNLTAIPFADRIADVRVSVDDVVLTAPNFRNGTYESLPIDAGTAVNWTAATWSATLNGTGTVAVDIRVGNTSSPGDATWTPWNPTAPGPLPLTKGRYLQYRASLATPNASRSVSLDSIQFDYIAHLPSGTVETLPLAPAGIVNWEDFSAVIDTPPGTSLTFEFAIDGLAWNGLSNPMNLTGWGGSSIVFRATLATTNGTLAPSLDALSLQYYHAGPLAAITLDPPFTTISADATADFTAMGSDADGNPVPVSPGWAADVGSANATGPSTGRYTPTRVGDWTVWANDSGASGAANVRVIPGALASILVTPDPAALNATDAPLQFLAWGFDAKGNARPANPSWNATGGGIGTATGIYTPGPLGAFTVYANDSGVSGSASVTVTAGPLSTLVVSPAAAALLAGGAQAYTAEGFDALGNPVAVSPTWERSGGGSFLANLFTATTAGTWTVYANDSGITGTATVDVDSGPLAFLVISPSSGNYAAGANVTFLLTGSDAFGNPVAPTATLWTWGAGGVEQGRTATTLRLRLPGTLGPFTVTATEGTASATANLLIVESALTADPTPLTLAEDSGLTLWDLTAAVGGDATANLRWRSVIADDPTLAAFAAGGFGDLVVRVTPLLNRHGSTTVTFVLENRTGHTATGTATLTVSPVNDAPTFSGPPMVFVKFGVPRTVDYAPRIHDVDLPADPLTLTTDDTERATVSALRVTYEYPETVIPTDAPCNCTLIPVVLNITDGRAWRTQTQIVNVTRNLPPTAMGTLPAVTMEEDSTRTDVFPTRNLADLFTDDGRVTYTATSSMLRTQLGTSGPRLTLDLTADGDWFGTDTAFLRATDDLGAWDEIRISVTVTPVNDAPVLALPFTTLFARFSETHTLDLGGFVTDPDPDDVHTFTASDSRATFDGSTLRLSYPQYTLVGPDPYYLLPLTITVDDGALNDTAALTVNVSNNAPPSAFPIPDVFRLEDQPPFLVTLSAFFFDPDEPAEGLGYGVAADSLDVQGLSPTGVLTLGLPANWYGDARVTVTVNDTLGALVVTTFTVYVQPVDDRPVFDPFPFQDFEVKVGTADFLDLRPYLSDIDDDLEELMIVTDSDHVRAHGLFLVFEYPAGSSDREVVTITVTDPGGESATQVLLVKTISGVDNFPPSPWLLLALALVIALGVALMAATRRARTFEDAFLLTRDGRLLVHKTRRKRADRDEDIYAAMIAAMTEFVKDSFREEGDRLKSFESQGARFLIEPGKHTFLAAIYGGDVPKHAAEGLQAFLEDVEEVFPGVERWSGDPEEFPGIGVMLEAFVAARRYRRGGWERYARRKGAVVGAPVAAAEDVDDT